MPASLYQSASVNTTLKISHDTYAAARNAEYTFPSPLYVSLIAACVDSRVCTKRDGTGGNVHRVHGLPECNHLSKLLLVPYLQLHCPPDPLHLTPNAALDAWHAPVACRAPLSPHELAHYPTNAAPKHTAVCDIHLIQGRSLSISSHTINPPVILTQPAERCGGSD